MNREILSFFMGWAKEKQKERRNTAQKGVRICMVCAKKQQFSLK
jgi:hypothetical protein